MNQTALCFWAMFIVNNAFKTVTLGRYVTELGLKPVFWLTWNF